MNACILFLPSPLLILHFCSALSQEIMDGSCTVVEPCIGLSRCNDWFRLIAWMDMKEDRWMKRHSVLPVGVMAIVLLLIGGFTENAFAELKDVGVPFSKVGNVSSFKMIPDFDGLLSIN